MLKIEVAGIVVSIDIPDRLFRDDIFKFKVDDRRREDAVIEMANEPFPLFPELEGRVPPVHYVYLSADLKYYLFSKHDSVNFLKYDTAYSRFIINLSEDAKDDEEIIEAVNCALRRIFIMIITAAGGISLHSSTVGLNGDAVCFSAGSGTGKTTHTNLWREHIPGVRILNGDKCYLFPQGDSVCFHSAPWCGTSGELINTEASVRAIVFLEQGLENNLTDLTVPQAFMQILTGCFLPVWDKELYLKAIDTAELLAGRVRCYHLKCLPDIEAVRVCYHGIYKC